MNNLTPYIKAIGTHALIVGGAAAAATIARDLFVLSLKAK